MAPGRDVEELWLRPFRRVTGSRVEMVFLPHAGGSATFFRKLADALPPRVDMSAVQYPGRQDRRGERPIDSIPVLATQIAQVLSPRMSRGLVLFGHSMGAVLAFEAARHLERDTGQPLTGLMASGRRAPSIHAGESLRLGGDVGLREELRALGGTDDEFLRIPELWDMIAPTLRADYQAIESYRYVPGPPLGCPVSVLIGDRDPRVSVAEAQAWQQHTSNRFRLRVFPGGHFYLADPAPELTSAITGDLAWFGSDDHVASR
jgi:surfactin synthase thioesterase subunit